MNIKEFFPKAPPKKVYTIEDEVQDEFNEFCNPTPIKPQEVFEQVDSVNKVLEHMLKTDPDLFNKYTFDSVYESAVYINNVLSKKVYTEDETAILFDTLLEDGRIVKNVNTTMDVNMDEITVQARKMGFNVTNGGVPAYLTPDGIHPQPINESVILEGRNHPVIVVDVQPEYEAGGDERTMNEIIQFVHKQTGPVLMFVNAEHTGVSADTKQDIQQYWENKVCGFENEEDRFEYDEEYDEYVEKECDAEINWDRFKIVDKGYGYLRGWMDTGVEERLIIKVIRTMYQQRVTDSKALFGGEGTNEYVQFFEELFGELPENSISVEWTSVKQLKQFDGAYIVGGGRDECLREVELLMNAFNIKYKRIDSLVYG